MPITTVLYGPAYDGKNREAFEKCLKKIRRHEGHSCLYLVRSDVRVRQLRDLTFRELSGCFHFPVSTFPDFMRHIYRKLPDAKRVLADLEQKILLQNILAEREYTTGKGFYFKYFYEQPGLVTKIKEFINGIRRIGISSAQELVSKFLEYQTTHRSVHEELLTLFARYTIRLDEANVIDDTGIFLEIARRAVSHQLDIRTCLPSPELFVLEGYYELTLPEQQIFTALCSQFEQTLLTLDLPFNPYNCPEEKELPKQFHIFQDFVRFIQRSGFSVREFSSSQSLFKDGQSNTIKLTKNCSPPLLGGVRGGGLPPKLPLRQPSDFAPFDKAQDRTQDRLYQGGGMLNSERLTIAPCRTRKDEVSEIARKIRKLSRENKISNLCQVGLTFPIIEQYEALIREIFPRFGIPFTMFQGFSLGASPGVVTIFRILQVILEDYSLESIAHLFSTPLVEFSVNEESIQGTSCTPLNAETYHELDSFARAAGIINGRKAWIEKLTAYQKTLEEQLSDQDSPAVDRSLPTAYCLLPTAYGLLDFLSSFEVEQYRSWGEFTQLLQETTRQFRIPHRILHVKEWKTCQRDLAALRKFLTLLETLQQEVSPSSSGSKPRTKRLTFKEFYNLLRIAVQGESYYLPGMLDDSVFVMGRLDTRQVQFRYLFFGGLVEKDFPGTDEPNIFLTSQEAESLGLPTYKRQFQETAYLFWLNTHNPMEHLHLSYPLQEGEKDVLRSTYIDRVIQSLERKEQEPPQEEIYDTYSPEDMYTYSELYQWLGEQVSHDHLSWERGHSRPEQGRRAVRIFAGRQACAPRTDKMSGLLEVLQYIEQEKGEEFVRNFLLGLKAQRLRMRDELSAFDGVLASQWSKHILDKRYRNHVYSVSEFDLYVRCPIKFFFQRIMCLEPLPMITRGITASDIGTLLHTIVYRFYTNAPAGQNMTQQGEADHEFLRRKVDKDQWIREAGFRIAHIAREEMEAYDFSGAFGKSFTFALLAGLPSESTQDLSSLTLQEQQGLLAKFIELDANDSDKVLPHYLEAHFGMLGSVDYIQSHSDSPGILGYELSSIPYTLRGKDRQGRMHTIKIRGEIDRIDLEPQTARGHSGRYKVVIYDYKTGSVPSVHKIKEGRFFQIPLYLLAAQELLGRTYEVIAGGYYQIKSAQEIGKKGILGSKEYAQQNYFKGSSRTLFDTYEEFLSLLQDYTNHTICVTQDIRKGRFHPTILGAQDAGCRYCEYQQICRVDHQRLSNLCESNAFDDNV